MKLEGVYAPIPTPFYQGDIAYDRLQENLSKWADTRLTGLVVCGSNGESVLLDEAEKVELTAFVRQHFPSDRPVIVGTGCESLKATINLTKRCADIGVNAALIVTLGLTRFDGHPDTYGMNLGGSQDVEDKTTVS